MIAMKTVAVGAYFRMLLNIQSFDLKDVAELADVQEKYIWRLETNAIKEPSTRTLWRITQALNGSWDDVGSLMTTENLSAEDGKIRALAWAQQAGLLTKRDRIVFEKATPEQLERAAEHLRQRAEELRQK